MKKLFLAFLVTMTLLLPALNNTSSAASKLSLKRVIAVIDGWVLFVSSNSDEGQITQINVYRLTTGELVRSQQCSGYEASVVLKDLPHGAYSAVINCQYTYMTKQFKL